MEIAISKSIAIKIEDGILITMVDHNHMDLLGVKITTEEFLSLVRSLNRPGHLRGQPIDVSAQEP